jgi:hypothetical protein
VTGGSNKRVSLAALIAVRPGQRPRLIYRVHHGRRSRDDQRKGFTEADYARLLDAAHQQLGGPLGGPGGDARHREVRAQQRGRGAAQADPGRHPARALITQRPACPLWRRFLTPQASGILAGDAPPAKEDQWWWSCRPRVSAGAAPGRVHCGTGRPVGPQVGFPSESERQYQHGPCPSGQPSGLSSQASPRP